MRNSLLVRNTLSVVLLCVTAFASPQNSSAQRFALSVMTDAVDPLPYPIAVVSQVNTYYTLSGDAEGDCPTLDIDSGIPMVVRLEEVPLTTLGGAHQAIAIGQHFTTVHPPAIGDAQTTRLHYFQPVARRLNFYAPYTTTDGESRWRATGTDSATYGFQAWAAELPNPDVISNYFAHKIGWHVELFENGLLIRCDDWVDLGAQGMRLLFDTELLEYPSGGPQVSVFSMSLPNYQGFAAGAVAGHSDGVLRVDLTGYLAPGDNLILMTSGAAGGVYVADPIGQNNGGSGQTDPNCEPSPPQCAGPTCNPPLPAHAYSSLPKDCVYRADKIGAPYEHPCGAESQEIKSCSWWEGGISAKYKPHDGGVEIGGHLKIGGSKCSAYTAKAGYRYQKWQCYSICTKRWDLTWTEWMFSVRYGHTTTKCEEESGNPVWTACKYRDCP